VSPFLTFSAAATVGGAARLYGSVKAPSPVEKWFERIQRIGFFNEFRVNSDKSRCFVVVLDYLVAILDLCTSIRSHLVRIRREMKEIRKPVWPRLGCLNARKTKAEPTVGGSTGPEKVRDYRFP
jgi:hypothetical protein